MTQIASIRTLSLRSSLFLLLPLFLFCGSACPEESMPFPTSPAARTISPGEMFTFFFLMLGPLKILGPFVQLAGQGDTQFARRLAFRAFFYSCLTLLFAAVIGAHAIARHSPGRHPGRSGTADHRRWIAQPRIDFFSLIFRFYETIFLPPHLTGRSYN
jgi:hypothetical protein